MSAIRFAGQPELHARKLMSTAARNQVVGVLFLAVMLASCGGRQTPVSNASPKVPVTWSVTQVPPQVDTPGVEWLTIKGAGGRATNVQVAAVVRPSGSGPFPLVVWLHGYNGFHPADIRIAAQLATSGIMVLVGCWNTSSIGGPLLGVNFACPDNLAASPDAVSALITVGEQLPGARKGAIGVFGVSAGGTEALSVMQERIEVSVVVVDSPACPCVSKPPTHAIHILFLGGTADVTVPVQLQQDAEQALRAEGYSVDDHYYPGSGHGVTYFESVHEDAMRRAIQFLTHYLGVATT
jgi:dienelactone hydrolase